MTGATWVVGSAVWLAGLSATVSVAKRVDEWVSLKDGLLAVDLVAKLAMLLVAMLDPLLAGQSVDELVASLVETKAVG